MADGNLFVAGKVEGGLLEAQDLGEQLDDIGRCTDWTSRSKT